MSAGSTAQLAALEGPLPASAEQRLKDLGIKLPSPPQPFGTGMLPTEGRGAKFIGRVGAELDVEGAQGGSSRSAQRPRGRTAAFRIARQGYADRPARHIDSHFGRCSRSAESGDAASELLRDVFGKDQNLCRLVYGVASLPFGAPVELEVIFEIGG